MSDEGGEQNGGSRRRVAVAKIGPAFKGGRAEVEESWAAGDPKNPDGRVAGGSRDEEGNIRVWNNDKE